MQQPSNGTDRSRELAAYRLTLADRRGADVGLLYRTVPIMLVLFAGWSTLFVVLGAPLVVGLPLGALLTGGFIWFGKRFATAAAEGFAGMVLPKGDSTPYEHQYSREDALAASGDIAGALESLEEAIAATPITAQTGVNVRIRAAELYMAKGANPKRAAELFREIQRFPGVTGSQDIYVSNRLIDLLLGPLKTPARALVELRRIVERYPSSSAAMHARTAIARLKAEAADAGL